MKKLRALIVDDEKLNRDILEILISKHCPELEVIAKSNSADDARLKIASNTIDILFLDIAMPNETGLELLVSIPNRRFSVIFITAYNQFAIKAIKANALDYILKPIDPEELKMAVDKAVLIQGSKSITSTIENTLNDNIDNLIGEINKNTNQITSLSFPLKNGYKIVKIVEVNYFEASNNYSIIHMVNREELVVSKSLKEFNEILDDNGFIRIHKSYLVNRDQISTYNRNDGMSIELNNGITLPVSRRRQSIFLDEFNL
tara:strand:+ start:333 stop:1109 length:777 start_codon:yes stop_codon:yes gene_type:complete